MPNCLFCDIVNEKAEAAFVYQDGRVSGFMDIQPVNAGHILVVPNTHATHLADLPEKTGGHMFRIAQRIAAAIRTSSLPCEGINFFLADGAAAGQEIFHVHLHVFPRFAGDGFGFKFSPDYFNRPSRMELDGVSEMIRQTLKKDAK